MASLVICYEQMAAFADQRRSFLNGCYLCLYKSSHVPAGSDTLATYAAIEADFPGYAAVLDQRIQQSGLSQFLQSGRDRCSADHVHE